MGRFRKKVGEDQEHQRLTKGQSLKLSIEEGNTQGGRRNRKIKKQFSGVDGKSHAYINFIKNKLSLKFSFI